MPGYWRADGSYSDGSSDVQLTGSNVKFNLPIVASPLDQAIPIPFTTKQVLMINDGADVLNYAFDGKPSLATQVFGVSSPALTFTGTWSNSTAVVPNPKYATTTGDNVVFKPGRAGLYCLTWDMVMGQGTGIAKLELSSDNGATWQNPSDISGISRSDGATGTAMNTFDGYAAVSVQETMLSFYLPKGNNLWALRITPNGTKNAASTNFYIFVVTFRAYDGNISFLNAKESIVIEIQTNQVNVSAASLVSGRVIAT